VHPNRADLADPTNQVFMNKGIVIKHNANQRYTTDAFSNAYFKLICESANALYQHYTNRSDQRGGGTLGSISSTQVSIPSCDIGLAQLAMHSALEVAGVDDYQEMVKALTKFYNANFKVEDNNIKM
jgi:aspartyl aminopeptidase